MDGLQFEDGWCQAGRQGTLNLRKVLFRRIF
jgi:hypothetical protein